MLNTSQPTLQNPIAYQILGIKIELDETTRLFVFCTLFTIASLPLLLSANLVDQRLLDGMPIWHKPLRFSVSLMLHFLTLAVLIKLVTPDMREAKRLGWIAKAACASLWFELSYIVIQAARGRRSHFNFETPLENTLYGLMGVGAFCLVLVSFVLGIMIWRYSNKENTGLRYGAISGLTLGSILTLLFAGFMSSDATYAAQKSALESAIIPYLGWSKTSGDYKPAHFVATHMMQLLPLFGVWLDKAKLGKRLSELIGKKNAIAIFSLLLTALAIALFIQALLGYPVIGL